DMDPTIQPVRDRASLVRDPLKTFENVTVTQIRSAGGRQKIEAAAAVVRKERSILAKEITELVRENWESSRGVLLFTFKPRGDRDLVALLRQDLADAGFDPETKTENDKN